jgi:hypothetical protein
MCSNPPPQQSALHVRWIVLTDCLVGLCNFHRRVGKCMVHGRRAMRAFGGVFKTLRGMQSMKHVLSLNTALKGWAVMRDMGIIRMFSTASVAASTLAGGVCVRVFLRMCACVCVFMCSCACGTLMRVVRIFSTASVAAS